MFIIYSTGYTNCKNILADFIDNLCFSNEMPEHRWRLNYPKDERIEDTTKIYESSENTSEIISSLKNKILEERKATISTVYTPPHKWTEHEIYKSESRNIVNGILEVNTNNTIYQNTIVEVMILPNKTYLYQNNDVKDIKDLSLLEFFVDYKNSKIYINVDGFENDILFDIRYQTKNLIAYTWYVSLIYPEYSFGYRPKKQIEKNIGNILINLNDCKYSNSSILLITNKDNILVGYGKLSDNKFGIHQDYRNIIVINNKEINISVDDKIELYIRVCNSENNNYNCEDLGIYSVDNINNENKLISYFNNCYSFLTPNINFDNFILGDELIELKDIKDDIIEPYILIENKTLKIAAKLNNIEDIEQKEGSQTVSKELNIEKEIFIYTNEEIKEINKKIDLENKKNLNNSYFIWQFGKSIDSNGFIERYKDTDSPVFSCFFHNFKDEMIDYSWNPLTYYLTWDDKECAFMFCEDPGVGDIVHGFSYFGILSNFKEKLKDDYIGNFGSFGNNVLETDIDEIEVPEFSGELTLYDKNKYNISVYLRSYFGPSEIQTVNPPLLNFINSEILIPIKDIIDIQDPNSYLIEYLMIGAEYMEYDKIDIVYNYEKNWWNYYIVFKDKTYAEPNLTPIEVVDYVEVYINDSKQITIPPIKNVDPDSVYIPLLTVENTNENIDVNFDGSNLTISPNGILEDTTIELKSEAEINKYGILLQIPFENKELKVVTWDFADVTYEVVKYE